MINVIRKGLLENGITVYGKNIHLAIVNEPFLNYIKNGKKTIESRFTRNKIAPYHQINEGDLVCMKAAGRPVDSCFTVKQVLFFENNPTVFWDIREKYAKEICALDEEFWLVREDKQFISLIFVENVLILKKPFEIPKKDMRGWVRFITNMPKDIILLSGKIGSGKSFWADQIANAFDCSRSSFSDYIKYKCIQHCKDCTRKNLQMIGAEIVEHDLDEFIYYTVFHNHEETERIVIDGLRHESVLHRIKELFPQSNVVVLFVDCDEEQRQQNLRKRSGEKCDCDNDVTEQGVLALRGKADKILYYSDNPEKEVKKISELFQDHTLFDY